MDNLLERRVFDRRLYLAAAILFPLIVLVGFGRTYYLKGLFGTPPLPSGLVHLHGLVMTAWVALFVVQVRFVSSKQIHRHRARCAHHCDRIAHGAARSQVRIGFGAAEHSATGISADPGI